MNFTSRFASPICAATSVLLLANCASIVSKKTWPVTIDAAKAGTEFVVKKAKDGSVVISGKTPQQLMLDSGAGYFKPGRYILETRKKGKTIASQELTATVNGWYWGNIAFGGLIGFLIVDPLTGAMYRLPKTVSLTPGQIASVSTSNGNLQVASIDSLSPDQRTKLVRL